MPNNSSYKDKDRIRKFEISPNQVQLESARPNLVQLELDQDRIKKYLKKTVFLGFWSVFCPVFCCVMDKIYIKRIFWRKNESSMLFVAAGVTDTKVRHSTGVATTNSTNKNPNANKLSWAINYITTIITSLPVITTTRRMRTTMTMMRTRELSSSGIGARSTNTSNFWSTSRELLELILGNGDH